MASEKARHPPNVAGPYWVDPNHCIDCGNCREIAPKIFRHYPRNEHSIVYRQPEFGEEWELAEEAMNNCPPNAICNDSDGDGWKK